MSHANKNNAIVTVWQKITWLVGHFLYRTIFHFSVVKKPKYDHISTRPLLIVGNHKSTFDPWFYMTTLPYKYYKATLPMRFIATTSPRHWFLKTIYWFITYPLIYWPNGVLILPPRKKDGSLTIDDKMKSTLESLKSREVVILFPEGGVKKKRGIHEFKRGAGYLQKNIKVPILCASVRIEGKSYLPWPLTKRYVNWSQELTYIPEHLLDDEKEGPEFLRKKVEELYTQK